VRKEESAETTCDSEDDCLGFRLVHDDSGRIIRDGSWRNTAVHWKTAPYVTVDPDYYTSYLGFRLVREDS